MHTIDNNKIREGIFFLQSSQLTIFTRPRDIERKTQIDYFNTS
jgi:hypothetical protein